MGFLSKAQAAIRSGGSGPASLAFFLMEKEIFRQLGQTREEFLKRPWKEAEDYVLLIQLIAREEQAQQQRQAQQKKGGRRGNRS